MDEPHEPKPRIYKKQRWPTRISYGDTRTPAESLHEEWQQRWMPFARVGAHEARGRRGHMVAIWARMATHTGALRNLDEAINRIPARRRHRHILWTSLLRFKPARDGTYSVPAGSAKE